MKCALMWRTWPKARQTETETAALPVDRPIASGSQRLSGSARSPPGRTTHPEVRGSSRTIRFFLFPPSHAFKWPESQHFSTMSGSKRVLELHLALGTYSRNLIVLYSAHPHRPDTYLGSSLHCIAIGRCSYLYRSCIA